jgi:hypothetical protein
LAVTPFKERVECALPARMMFALMVQDIFVIVDPVKGTADKDRCMQLLKAACFEPLDGLPNKMRVILAKQIDRIHAHATDHLDQQRADKVAAAIFYFLKEITDTGYLELWEGSPVAEATALFIPMFEHVFENEKLDQSAQKNARKILTKLQERGYYV